MGELITWTNERRKLGDLIPWLRNPRQIKGDQAKRLDESFTIFGQVEPIVIGPGNELYNGHQRLNVLSQKHGKDFEVEVRVSSRPLTEKEHEKLTVFLHKGAMGEWDFDALANNFDVSDLLEWGFRSYELGIPGAEIVDDPVEEWTGMPEFNREPLASRTLKVHFKTPEDVETFARLIGQNITNDTKFVWFPAAEKRDLKSVGYITDES